MHRNDGHPTVLVVNHDVWERRYTTDLLASQGYSVMDASNGASGLRLAEQNACDAIVMDLALPEVTGMEFIRRLKAMHTTRAVPVIVLGERATAQSVGSAGYVPKPLQPRRIMSELARCLRNARVRRTCKRKSR